MVSHHLKTVFESLAVEVKEKKGEDGNLSSCWS